MDEKTKNKAEFIRAVVRPILIFFLGVSSFLLIINYDVLSGPWPDIWIAIFAFGGCEWILERPIGKLLSNVTITKK
jgi:hypothetical protein